MQAAEHLGVEVVVGTDSRQAMEREVPGRTLAVDLRRPERSVSRIAGFHEEYPLDAVVACDDESVVLAAMASAELGLPNNPPAAAVSSRDKRLTRRRQYEAGMRTPVHVVFETGEDPLQAAARVRYPCVLKPLFLSGGRGVMRADDADGFREAFERIRTILARPEVRRRDSGEADRILVEDFIPGIEVSVEGLLRDGVLHVLAVFDKPIPLVGPTFEETMFITPSRLCPGWLDAIREEARRGCAALGLREGPVHVELRVRDGEPWLLEVGARTIGGLCARALRFGAGVSLEELVLRHALGMDTASVHRDEDASGVMMLPIPGTGRLRKVSGVRAAREVPGIRGVEITVTRGEVIEPPPEGSRYLGFIFASGDDPTYVEAALHAAHGRLSIELEPL